MESGDFYKELAEIRRIADERWQLLVATAAASGGRDAAGKHGNGNGSSASSRALIALCSVVVLGLAGYTTIIGVTTRESASAIKELLRSHTSERGHVGVLDRIVNLEAHHDALEQRLEKFEHDIPQQVVGVLNETTRLDERVKVLESKKP